MTDETLLALNEARARGEAVVLATPLDGSAERLIRPLSEPGKGPLHDAARDAVRTDVSGSVEVDGVRVFLNVFNPPVRVVVVGAVHIAQPLSVMATRVGYAVTVVDPRAAFATEERFPGIPLERSWPDEALERLRPDHRTAIVTVTHDPKLDDPALAHALGSDAFYIGALGSRRTHARRVERLTEAGFTETDLGRIHAPVGLDIGARTPGEIATSVLAQIVGRLRRP